MDFNALWYFTTKSILNILIFMKESQLATGYYFLDAKKNMFAMDRDAII